MSKNLSNNMIEQKHSAGNLITFGCVLGDEQ